MDKLAEARAAYNAAVEARKKIADEILDLADDTPQEKRDTLGTAFAAADEEFETRKARHDELVKLDEARKAQPTPSGTITVEREPLTYERGNGQSYLLDLARKTTGAGLSGADERISRHAAEMRTEMKKRNEEREKRASLGIDSLLEEVSHYSPVLARALERDGLVEKRAVSRTDTTSAGEFVPPLWLIDDYAGLARAGRPFANRVRSMPLPGGTDSINIPRITTGSLTAMQTADNQSVSSQDIVSATVTAPVRTIAGQEDVAMQLLDQSPASFDEIVFADLLADLALQLDKQCVNGTGSSGQILGVLNVSSIGTVTFTSGSPTVPLAWPKLIGSLNTVQGSRFKNPDSIWMHTQRWNWMLAALDSSTRPFVVPTSNGPNNALFSGTDVVAAQDGPVSYIGGIPVYVDLNIPTNLGGGTNQDIAFSTVMSDHILFEGDIQVRALKEVLSGTLGVRFQAYQYVAFTAGRFPGATCTVGGTGFVAPTF
jgi:HK97 family phage major capsid protein